MNIKYSWLIAALIGFPLIGSAQSIKVQPEAITIEVGEQVQLEATVLDQNGQPVKDAHIRYFGRSLEVDTTGLVTAVEPGDFKVIVISPVPGGNRIRVDVPVQVKFPPIATIQLSNVPENIYAQTRIPLSVKIFDKLNFERKDATASFSSSDESVAVVDEFYQLHAFEEGKATLTGEVDGIEAILNIEVLDNPTTALTMTSNASAGRTGDVFHFKATPQDENGNVLEDIPIYYSFVGVASDVSSSASGLIKQDGRFVADEAGLYTITATAGPYAASQSVKVSPRNVDRKVELVGHGTVSEKHTSDFWVWEGIDGKDYAVTGTWGADGTAYFWDVTNPGNFLRIDSIQVDARTVNDVKVSEDGTICVISREGASNRKNGIVILDVRNPRDVQIISTFTENLTGGVHNLFIYQNHVYALSAGRKYYVVNIEDPKTPKIVGEFELETPGHAIHDVWIEDGIAYSSNWQDGVQLVDVGNGIAGGSPTNPVQFASYAYPSGWHHATFPFRSQTTGKFYVIMGDETFPYGLNPGSKEPSYAGGWLHIVDFTDLDNPEEIAQFKVPGAGSHNYWVKDDLLYAAFYNGGVRVIDISGELMGDLNRQGREIGWIKPADPNGFVPNAPFTWGAQPHKGHIFYSDWNSGLWAAKLEPERPEPTKVETK